MFSGYPYSFIIPFLKLFVLVLLVKEIFFQLSFGKAMRNVRFVINVFITTFLGVGFFSLVMYLFIFYFTSFLVALYFINYVVYLIFFFIVFLLSMFSVDFIFYHYVSLRGRISKSDLAGAVVMANSIAYLLAYVLGLLTAFGGL